MQVAATINKQAFMLVVDTGKQPWRTLAELTAAMKRKGEQATYGASANIGLIMGGMYRELAGLAGRRRAVQIGSGFAQRSRKRSA